MMPKRKPEHRDNKDLPEAKVQKSDENEELSVIRQPGIVDRVRAIIASWMRPISHYVLNNPAEKALEPQYPRVILP